MRFIATLLLLAFASACYLPKSRSYQPLSTVATYAASKDSVWAAVMSEIAVNYRVQILDRESGFLGIETMYIPIGPNRPMTDWVFMPDEFFGTWETLSLSMNILVEELDTNITKVTVRTGYQALETRVYGVWIACETNGRLEQMVLQAIEQRLKL